MRIIETRQDKRFLAWIAEVAKIDYQDAVTIAHLSINEDKSADILAVVAYNNITKYDCCMHIATTRPDWASKKFLGACFEYPFKHLKLNRVTFAASTENEKALKLHRKLGAKHEGTLRGYFGQHDLVISGIQKDECKWVKHG